jgi:hypothetical protein
MNAHGRTEPRRRLARDWRARALRRWKPGRLVSWPLAFPDEPRDYYLLEGNLFHVELACCADPDCPCEDAWLAVRRITPAGSRQEACARFSAGVERPAWIDGDPELFAAIFAAWSRRHAAAAKQLAERRATLRERAVELHRLALERRALTQHPRTRP